MQIDNVKIYDLEESIIASGLPMQANYIAANFAQAVKELKEQPDCDASKPHLDRAFRLAANPTGSGHCNFLSGIIVSYNITATQVFWMQMERYHFNQIVSSQSKMHRASAMDIGACCHPSTDSLAITAAREKQFAFERNQCSFEDFVYSLPMGFQLTARCVTNYLQLKTIYAQRKYHKLGEWRDFCGWIETLPYADKLICGEVESEDRH